MIIFPDYVASFTSQYTYQSACKKISENEKEYQKGLSLKEKSQESDSIRMEFVPHGKISFIRKAFFPKIEVVLKEKTEGALVFSRIKAKKFTKLVAFCLALILIVAFACLLTLAILGNVKFVFPVLFVPFSVVFCMLVERLWAKLCCIKTYRLICNTLDHKPKEVMIIKVLKK
jgi:hypothetical protein